MRLTRFEQFPKSLIWSTLGHAVAVGVLFIPMGWNESVARRPEIMTQATVISFQAPKVVAPEPTEIVEPVEQQQDVAEPRVEETANEAADAREAMKQFTPEVSVRPNMDQPVDQNLTGVLSWASEANDAESNDAAPAPAPMQETEEPSKPVADKPVAIQHPETASPSPSTPSNIDSAATTPARPADNPPPAYPRLAVKRGYEGSVTLLASVDAQGRCTGVSILSSSGHGILDDAAVAAVRRWTFVPGLNDAGHPVPATVRVPVRFVLQD